MQENNAGFSQHSFPGVQMLCGFTLSVLLSQIHDCWFFSAHRSVDMTYHFLFFMCSHGSDCNDLLPVPLAKPHLCKFYHDNKCVWQNLKGGAVNVPLDCQSYDFASLCVIPQNRTSILSEVSTRSSSKLPSGKNILIFGKYCSSPVCTNVWYCSVKHICLPLCVFEASLTMCEIVTLAWNVCSRLHTLWKLWQHKFSNCIWVGKIMNFRFVLVVAVWNMFFHLFKISTPV